MYKRILVPLDGSKMAEGVLPHATALARFEGAEIILLRVAVNPALEFAFTEPSIAGSVVDKEELAARRYMNAKQSQLSSEGLQVSVQLRDGAVPSTILEVAEEVGADLIAMSTHGRSGPQRWLMGSVADRVVQNSKIPILLIRAKL